MHACVCARTRLVPCDPPPSLHLGGEDPAAALRASPRHRVVGLTAEQVAGDVPPAAGVPEVSAEQDAERELGAGCGVGEGWVFCVAR